MVGIIIAIVNNEGGVGKTTVAVNLAHALTRRDKRLLVVDMDTQCNATSLLLSDKFANRSNLYEVFSETELDIANCIFPTKYEKFFCLSNTSDTGALEPALLNALPEKKVLEFFVIDFEITLIKIMILL